MDDEEEYDIRARASSPSVILYKPTCLSRINEFLFQRTNYSILPRRSLSRTRQHVQFEDSERFSSSFSDQTLPIKPIDDTTFDEKLLHTSKTTTATLSSKNSTNTTEEFYSPNTSIEENTESEKQGQNKFEAEIDTKFEEIIKEKDPEEIQTKTDIVVDDIDPKLAQSPRARRSYKRK